MGEWRTSGGMARIVMGWAAGKKGISFSRILVPASAPPGRSMVLGQCRHSRGQCKTTVGLSQPNHPGGGVWGNVEALCLTGGNLGTPDRAFALYGPAFGAAHLSNATP